MKKVIFVFILGINILLLPGCKKNWLDRESKTLVTNEQVWNDPKQILALLGNYYDRLPTDLGLRDINQNGNGSITKQEQWRNMANYDDAMWSGYSGEDGRNNISSYAFSSWRYWDYTFIRDCNLALENMEKYGTALSAAEKKQFTAEFRFLRAFMYFEMVKRMGGVPLVTKQLIYDYSGDPSPLQQPRAKESEVYDFIGSEMDAIKVDLGNFDGTKSEASYTRANKYTAMALKSRAMLYAGSLAKYNSQMASPITTPGGEVGIPASKANEYYQKSLDASKEIINSGIYSLYKSNPNLGENFYEAITKKTNNKEVIFVKDFLTSKAKKHGFSYDNIARSIREDNLGSSAVTPVLNLVESFDYTDGTTGTLKTRTSDNSDFIYYDNLADIFANKDARLYGTVIYPGTTFKGLPVQMQAGVMVWNGSSYTTVEGTDLSTNYQPDGKLLTGSAGPHRSIQEVSNTGFYLRKFIDPGALTSSRGIQSDIWWIWFRLGEIYMNATEAAFELNQVTDALTYINALRARAGITVPLTSDKLSINKIRNERRVELAFEDHRLWDLKRWRVAHEVWNGDAGNPNAMLYALYPYRVVRPGDPRDGKYVFVKLVAPRYKAPRFFQMGNYYSSIDQAVINNNPKIIRNPFH
ncbi:RagB/SusD family nutrient uptake outer membrane protein [Chitinophagaceae bacterium LB-8]|uniref:RagB/SusD family nutrient uptake outer membrane protein n=1 Tax=Paraflavisolibacter caeni TaxID=2982496 RepID=A0A9X2XTE2_9BACT|nr:RagB/SusD family nutrient uptake outer membrane protein [Paraflavisolibacter caeni]MCU7548869.1 RagB/SusD family nutrient uptake outer membrane protein [Paraflavisolibacter caeni]